MEVVSMSISSNIKKAGYDKDEERLFVQFQRGHIYFYDNVPVSVWKEWKKAAGSYGRFFYHNIRGVYPARNTGKR